MVPCRQAPNVRMPSGLPVGPPAKRESQVSAKQQQGRWRPGEKLWAVAPGSAAAIYPWGLAAPSGALLSSLKDMQNRSTPLP